MRSIVDDEFGEIYGDIEGGFLFYYSNGRLSRSYPLDRFDVSELEPGKVNKDNIVIQCDSCSTIMDYVKNEKDINGKWKCPKCCKTVRESTPYNKLDEENERLNKDDYDEYYE